MSRAGTGLRAATAVVAIALMLLSVGFSYAVAADYADRGICPAGSRVQGVDVGGLSHDVAVVRVRAAIDAKLFTPLTLTFRGTSAVMDARSAVSLDVPAMVDETFAPRRASTLAGRVYGRLVGERSGAEVTRRPKVDPRKVAAFVAAFATKVGRKPVDSRVTVAGHAVRISRSSVGYALDRKKASAIIAAALADGRRDVKPPVSTLRPKVTEASVGKTIVVDRGAMHLYLYDRTKLERDYPVAVGQPEWPTPLGRWHVVAKEYMPSWHNPHSAWSAGMPDVIGPGYDNPLGTRALALDASGVLIHGSANDASIGTPASHGCMRMHMSDIEDLYERVREGTRVFVVP